MSHSTEENRKKIANLLAHEFKCCEIAEEIGCDPTTIAKEIKKNRVISRDQTKGGIGFYVKNLINGLIFAERLKQIH